MLPRTPLITLITTFRDPGEYLAEALASVDAQTIGDWELVLWNDGSSDSSPAIARDFQSKYPSKVKLVTSSKRGRNAALRGAHQMATGQYLAWLDADDSLHPRTLELTSNLLEGNADCAMAYTEYAEIDAEGLQLRAGPSNRLPFSRERLLKQHICWHFRLFRRKSLGQAGGVGDFDLAIDYDMVLRVSEIGDVIKLPQTLYYYRRHPGQLSFARRAEQDSAARRARNLARHRRGLPSLVCPDRPPPQRKEFR